MGTSPLALRKAPKVPKGLKKRKVKEKKRKKKQKNKKQNKAKPKNKNENKNKKNIKEKEKERKKNICFNKIRTHELCYTLGQCIACVHTLFFKYTVKTRN